MPLPTCRLATLLLAAAFALPARAADGASRVPASCSPALERAAAALAEGRRNEAREAFLAVAADQAAPAFIRGVARLGAATAEASAEARAAAWQRIADDAVLPPAHRDEARRALACERRVAKGLPAHDTAAYRVQLPHLPDPAVVLHVAPEGNDAADGSEARPFATLAKARDAVQALRAPQGGARIVVHGGTYRAAETFVLAAEDSGTAAAPIVYQAAPGHAPVFTGGVQVPAWRPVSDAQTKDKLDAAIRERVLEADLAALGVKDLGDATDLRRAPELFIDGAPQTLARWPNEGFVATGDILGTDTFKVWDSIPGCKDGKFRYVEDRPSLWIDEPDVRLYGYWFWDWYEEFQKVAAIDPAAHVFTLATPYSQYGYRKGQRYRAVNVLREIDRPGEWYLDRRSSLVYWLPPEGDSWKNATATVSVLAVPFVRMENVAHVLLVGLTFEDGRADGIHVRGGEQCVIAGCTLRRMGGDAIVVEGGQRDTIFGCTMETLGCGGTRVAGGDRASLRAGGHTVENCTVADISRLKRTYAPAVLLDGCGNRVAHNRFERIPSSAMRVEGNDHVIELNAIRHVVQESDDQGGLDMFGNPLYRGVVIRWNRWSDIVGGTHCGAAGVRLDDMISGVAVYGNIFERCGAALFGGLQIHGGKENLVDGNVFIDCFAGVSFSRWGEQRWREAIKGFLKDAVSPANTARYPELAHLERNADINFLARNAFVRCKEIYLRDGGVARSALNAVIDDAFDANALESPTGDARLARVLAPPIPCADIGPYEHAWRAPSSTR